MKLERHLDRRGRGTGDGFARVGPHQGKASAQGLARALAGDLAHQAFAALACLGHGLPRQRTDVAQTAVQVLLLLAQVRNSARDVGSSCIAERRVIEMLDHGSPRTGFMQFGDRVRMEARWPGIQADGQPGPFGVIDQQVVASASARR